MFDIFIIIREYPAHGATQEETSRVKLGRGLSVILMSPNIF